MKIATPVPGPPNLTVRLVSLLTWPLGPSHYSASRHALNTIMIRMVTVSFAIIPAKLVLTMEHHFVINALTILY